MLPILIYLDKINHKTFSSIFFKAIGAVCRQAGHRFGDHVERVVPMVLKYAHVEDDELR